MPKRSTRTGSAPTVSVKFTDTATGKSISFTVYGENLKILADYAQTDFASRWVTTKLTDRRHKRRL